MKVKIRCSDMTVKKGILLEEASGTSTVMLNTGEQWRVPSDWVIKKPQKRDWSTVRVTTHALSRLNARFGIPYSEGKYFIREALKKATKIAKLDSFKHILKNGNSSVLYKYKGMVIVLNDTLKDVLTVWRDV